MSDFLPIGLGRNESGDVSHFQEITSSDSIPENYLQISNTSPKWNASALQSYTVSDVTPQNNYVLTWNQGVSAWYPKSFGGGGGGGGGTGGASALIFDATEYPLCVDEPTTAGQVLAFNGSEWCPSTLVEGGIQGPVSVPAGNIVKWINTTSIEDAGWNFDPTAPVDGNIIYWDGNDNTFKDAGYKGTQVIIDSDVGSPIFNANRLNGVSACGTTPTAGQVLVYNSTISAWCPSTLVITGGGGGTADATSIQGEPVPDPAGETAQDVLVWNGANLVWEPRVKASGPLTSGKIIIGDSLGGLSSSPVTLGTFINEIDGNVIRYLSATSAIVDGGWGLANPTTGFTTDHILQWSSVGTTRRIVDSGYSRTDAAWNANKLYGVALSAAGPSDDGKFLRYNNSAGSAGWVGLGAVVQTIPLVGNNGSPEPPSLSPVRLAFVDPSGTLLSVSATSSIPDGSFFVTSGVSVVPAYLPYKLLRFYGVNTSSYPNAAGPAEAANAEGQLLYFDATNDRWTNTLNLKVDSGSNLLAANVSSTGTVRAVTVSATNYVNLPSSTIVWASAGYASLAGSATTAYQATSATSALYAVLAPSGFSVTGTLYASTVSATNYRNIRPYVSAVDSATTTTVNMGEDYDTYLVNTTTTSVTLYLPDASAWTSKQITVSKIDDGGSYRSVTLSGTTLQTATQTVRLYDPTESVTVISNGTNWYSLDYDRAYGVVVVAKNSTGSTLTKGTPVRVTGATGDNVLIGAVSAANNHVPEASNGSLSKCIGVVEHSIPDGEFGHVLTKGTLYKFDTNAFNEGDTLYLASGGGFTNVKPPAPYDEVFLGIVTRKQSVNGSILIDVENPIHVNDIAGFDLASGIINGDLISYSTATSTFTNVQAVNVSGHGYFGSVSATNYLNLPSSTIVWASAGYASLAGSSTLALNATSATLAYQATSATLAYQATSATLAYQATSATTAVNATSATSALNAAQAPNGFNVTGTVRATAVSATTVSTPTINTTNIYATNTVSANNFAGDSINVTNYFNLPPLNATYIGGYNIIDPVPVTMGDVDVFIWDGINELWTVVPSSTFAGGGGAPTDAQYLTLASNGTLTNERVFTIGAGLGSNDAGAGGNFTVSAVHTSAIWNANKLQGYNVSSVAPSNNQVLTYNTTVSAWVPNTSTGISQAAAMTIVGFGGF